MWRKPSKYTGFQSCFTECEITICWQQSVVTTRTCINCNTVWIHTEQSFAQIRANTCNPTVHRTGNPWRDPLPLDRLLLYLAKQKTQSSSNHYQNLYPLPLYFRFPASPLTNTQTNFSCKCINYIILSINPTNFKLIWLISRWKGHV
jgi:hypothetical protein